MIGCFPSEPAVDALEDLMTIGEDAKAHERQQQRLERTPNRQILFDAKPAVAVYVQGHIEEQKQNRAPTGCLRQSVLERFANDEVKIGRD